MTYTDNDPTLTPHQQGLTPEAYHLSEVALNEAEQRVVDLLHEAGAEGTVAIVLPGDHELANFGRTYEDIRFNKEGGEEYDFFEGMRAYEPHSLFLYTVDLGLGKIAHVKRLVDTKTPNEREATQLTGIEVLDDRLTASATEEGAALDALIAFHKIKGLDKVLNVTTNLGTERVDANVAGLYTLASYKALLQLSLESGVEQLFAYLNGKAVRSLGRVGVESALLGGESYHLPIPDKPGEYDPGYEAVCIPISQHNIDAFTKGLPEFPITEMIAATAVPLYDARSRDAGGVLTRLV